MFFTEDTARRFVRQFNKKHIIKHTLVTAGLTLVAGYWGFSIGLMFCLGDTIDNMKKFSKEDFRDFYSNLPVNLQKKLAEKWFIKQ